MLKEERHRYIIDRINKDNRIYVTDLSVELKVSDDTLRRDLVELENSGLLTKVHGGAIAKSDISIQFSERLNTATLVKQEMAAQDTERCRTRHARLPGQPGGLHPPAQQAGNRRGIP